MALKIEQVTVNGYKGEEKKQIEGVLRQWLELVNQYSQLHNDPNSESGDECYWYNERATLSVLAAAAWQKEGWCALEEFSNEKHRKTGKKIQGRCDLYMTSEDISYACEAKQAWQPIGENVNTDNGYLINKLDEAEFAAKELDLKVADRRLALCFCIPSFPFRMIKNKKNDRDKISASTIIIQDWLEVLKKDKSVALNKSVAFAYTFPVNARLITPEDGKRIFPGVALIIREIKRGNKKS